MRITDDRRRLPQPSLRTMLVVPYVVLIAVLTAVIGLISYHSSRNAIDTWSEQLLIETVERIKQAVDRHVAGSAAVLEVAFPDGLPAPQSLNDSVDELRTRFWLATSVHRDPNNYAYYGDRNGRFFGLMRHSESAAEIRLRREGEGARHIYRFNGIHGELGEPAVEKRIFEPRERPWFVVGQTSVLHTWTSIYIDFKTSELVATRARRVNDSSGNFAGVIATDLSLLQVSTFLKGLTLSENGIALVVERDGKLVGVSRGQHLSEGPEGQRGRLNAADSPDPFIRSTYNAVSGLLASSSSNVPATAVFEMPDGQVTQVGFSRLRDDAGLDWIVMVAVPRDDFQHEVETGFKIGIALWIVAAFCVAVLGMWVLSVIAKELRKLAEAAKRVGEGHLNTPLYTDRKDEIGQLANSFVEMQKRLHTDSLTSTANREAIVRRIESQIQQRRRPADENPFAILFADINDFKKVNDRFGHDVGDEVLREFAMRITSNVRAEDMVARYAGDEFIVLLGDIGSREYCQTVRDNLEKALKEPLESLPVASTDARLAGAAIGMAVFPDDGRDVDTLIRVADADMYRRKKASRAARFTSPLPG